MYLGNAYADGEGDVKISVGPCGKLTIVVK